MLCTLFRKEQKMNYEKAQSTDEHAFDNDNTSHFECQCFNSYGLFTCILNEVVP
jgi:hypothetical protein